MSTLTSIPGKPAASGAAESVAVRGRAPGRAGFSLEFAVIAFGLLLIALLWGAVIMEVSEEREDEIQRATRSATNLARVFEEHTVRTLREADQLLVMMRHEYAHEGRSIDLNSLVADLPFADVFYNYLSIVDEHGNLVAGSRPFAPVNLADREYFKVHAPYDTGEPFISKPVVGRASGQRSIQLTRRINKPDHSFGGIAVVSLSPDYFSRLYGELDLGKHGLVAIVGRDGVVRARRAGEASTVGQDVAGSGWFARVGATWYGAHTGADTGDGIERIVNHRWLADYPLAVVVGVSTDEALAAFHERLLEEYLAAVIASLAIAAFITLLVIAMRRRDRERRKADATRAELTAIVENSNEAIIARALDGTITAWNAGAERILGYRSAEIIGKHISILKRPGMPSQVQENTHRVSSGEIVPSFESQVVARDGRMLDVLVSVSPVRDAHDRVVGASGIFHDISPLKRAERTLLDKTKLAQLLEGLARAASEAASAGDAMRKCIEHICRYGNWPLGHVIALPDRSSGDSVSSLWHVTDRERYTDAIECADNFDLRNISGSFLGAALRERRPVWVADMKATPMRGRTGQLTEKGIRAGFVFPVVARDEVLALLEFFSDEPRPADKLLLENIGNVGAQLARLIERERAAAESGRYQRELQRSMDLAQLLETLARAANEASGPEDAMRRILELLAEHGRWDVGHCMTFAPGQTSGTPQASFWHGAHGERYRAFMDYSDNQFQFRPGGSFTGRVMSEKRPVWLEDISISDRPYKGRLPVARDLGLKGALALPVIVGGEVAAILEFFAEAPRKPDALLLESIANVASQLARMVERSRAQTATAQLAAIVDCTGDAIVSRGMDGKIRTWNPAAQRMFGWAAQEAIGQSISIIIPAERRGEMRPLIERVMAGETVGAIESLHCRKDGTRFSTSVSLSAIRGADGAVTGISLIYRDISERKRLEQAERSSAALTRLLESLARASNEATTPVDAMRRCLQLVCEHGHWALGAVGVFGGEHAGVPQATYWHGADSGRFAEFIERSDATDHTATRGHFVGKVLRERKPVWMHSIAEAPVAGRMALALRSGLRSAFAFPVIVGGEVAAFLEFFATEEREPDQSMLAAVESVGGQLARLVERERASATIRENEARLRAILDSEPECVKVIKTDGTLLDMNRAGLKFLEADSLERVREYGILNFVLPSYRDKFRAFIGESTQGGRAEIEFEIEGLKGARRWMQSYAAPIALPQGGGDTLVVVTRDITERKQAQEKADYLSSYDALTGLPNRNLFRDRLELAVAHARRRNEVLGVLRLNLDRFKKINESLGHAAGDELLKEVAVRLKAALREVDTIARLGGNDYGVLVEGTQAPGDVIAVAEKLVKSLAFPFKVQGHEVFVSASVGVALCSNGACESEKVMESAEVAMSHAKRDGGGGYQLYKDEPITLSGKRLTLETRLRYALENGELEVHYQPKVRLDTGAVTGMEALLRWNSPQCGAVSPAQFIPIAEETGLIVPIGAWAMEAACAQTAKWRKQGHDLHVAVNLSPRQFRQKDLVSIVEGVLARTGLAAQFLELEITEGTAMSNAEQTIAVLGELRRLGLKLSVDDFGTGYSSLSYLKRFPLNCLKMDRSFIKGMAANAQDLSIVTTIIALARALDLRVVAEGVETEEQARLLRLLRSDEAQGFLYSKPLPASALAQIVERAAPIAPSSATPAGEQIRRPGVTACA